MKTALKKGKKEDFIEKEVSIYNIYKIEREIYKLEKSKLFVELNKHEIFNQIKKEWLGKVDIETLELIYYVLYCCFY